MHSTPYFRLWALLRPYGHSIIATGHDYAVTGHPVRGAMWADRANGFTRTSGLGYIAATDTNDSPGWRALTDGPSTPLHSYLLCLLPASATSPTPNLTLLLTQLAYRTGRLPPSQLAMHYTDSYRDASVPFVASQMLAPKLILHL